MYCTDRKDNHNAVYWHRHRNSHIIYWTVPSQEMSHETPIEEEKKKVSKSGIHKFLKWRKLQPNRSQKKEKIEKKIDSTTKYICWAYVYAH